MKNIIPYIVFESFTDTLIELFSNISHVSEWYDIAFQIAMINNFTSVINNYKYDCNIWKMFIYKRHTKTIL